MTKDYDVLVLGAGPAGIAAARYLRRENVSFLVLEARSRVGGRAYTSDSLGANRPLDHGARWIHGACSDNIMVKLVREMEFNHPEDEGVEYEVCLPWEEDNVKPKAVSDENTATTSDDETPPPFELFDSETEEVDPEPMIVKMRNEKRTNLPAKNIKRILTKSQSGVVSSKEGSMDARRVARKVFEEAIKSALKDPHETLHTNSDSSMKEEVLEGASLMDLLLWSHQHPHQQLDEPEETENEKQRQALFSSLCRDILITNNHHVQKAAALLDTEEERAAFRGEVFAFFNLKIYTFFESWEGAPIHSISAKYGMESTCLPGGNVVLPFGYGGLVKRLAYPLIQDKSIRLEQQVVSIQTTENSDKTPKVVVLYKASNDDNGELQKIQAATCIIALPLGVLRAAVQRDSPSSSNRSIAFEPGLPSPLVRSIQSLGIAVRNKIEFLFPTRWWPETIGRITLACTHLQQTPTYHPYTTFIVESSSSSESDSDSCNPNILVCYVAGEFARETEQKTNEQIQEECMAVLRQADLASGQAIPDPIALHVTRWLQDPYARGSWTFYGKGSSPEDVRAFRSNEDCQTRGLFFAGEHTCDGAIKGDDMGCVHGAWVSGELAAEVALKRLRK